MKIYLELSAQLREKAGRISSPWEVDEAMTLQDFVRQLARQVDGEFKRFILNDQEDLRPMILLSVNNRQVSWDMPHRLQDRDLVQLFSPISGG